MPSVRLSAASLVAAIAKPKIGTSVAPANAITPAERTPKCASDRAARAIAPAPGVNDSPSAIRHQPALGRRARAPGSRAFKHAPFVVRRLAQTLAKSQKLGAQPQAVAPPLGLAADRALLVRLEASDGGSCLGRVDLEQRRGGQGAQIAALGADERAA